MVSMMPLEALCCDHHHGEEQHQTEETHHGVIMCHAACCGVVLISIQSIDVPDGFTSFTPAPDFSYDEPILPTEYRPPIVVS